MKPDEEKKPTKPSDSRRNNRERIIGLQRAIRRVYAEMGDAENDVSVLKNVLKNAYLAYSIPEDSAPELIE